jgi:hypothetical protein
MSISANKPAPASDATSVKSNPVLRTVFFVFGDDRVRRDPRSRAHEADAVLDQCDDIEFEL